MTPRILPRAEHNLSRKAIDPDALKVLYRLKNHDHLAYLVGGGVRDLLLGREPKDFDVGTSAHPQQIRRLFRNSFVVGRRFRLCHVRFGRNVIEVSTFRRQAETDDGDPLIRRDNTFGTPEEDAFRRDFTVNALFYDIATFSVIDYVGGLEDLEARLIRTIGDPGVRFLEDPVRMLRAVALAARLDFEIDRDTLEAIRSLRGEIVKAAPPRLLEEFYKILRQGAARRTFDLLNESGLLTYLLPSAQRALASDGAALAGSLERLDTFRRDQGSAESLTNPLLAGSLLVPLGLTPRRGIVTTRPGRRRARGSETPPEEDARDDDVAAELAALDDSEQAGGEEAEPVPIDLPFARRDLDRMRLILVAQRRLLEGHAGRRGNRQLTERAYFPEALRWLEIHGGAEGGALAEEWRAESTSAGESQETSAAAGESRVAVDAGENGASEAAPPTRRRRRRRGGQRRPRRPERGAHAKTRRG